MYTNSQLYSYRYHLILPSNFRGIAKTRKYLHTSFTAHSFKSFHSKTVKATQAREERSHLGSCSLSWRYPSQWSLLLTWDSSETTWRCWWGKNVSLSQLSKAHVKRKKNPLIWWYKMPGYKGAKNKRKWQKKSTPHPPLKYLVLQF